jgi:uncharacterized protein YndB with AHSA1/START domain
MPATPRETSVLEHEIRVAAAPETVFSYFTDPVKMVQWMGAEAMLDPRPGGVCRIVFRTTEAGAQLLDAVYRSLAPQAEEPAGHPLTRVMSGQFVELEPHRRIVLTWGWEEDLYAMPPQSTQVEISLTEDGAETILRLAHRRLPSAAAPVHQAGWQQYLPRLAIVAAGGDPGPDPWQAAADADRA